MGLHLKDTIPIAGRGEDWNLFDCRLSVVVSKSAVELAFLVAPTNGAHLGAIRRLDPCCSVACCRRNRTGAGGGGQLNTVIAPFIGDNVQRLLLFAG